MAKFFIMAMIAATMVSCSSPKASMSETGAESLFKRLESIQQKGYMYGHQDDPFYGLTWEWDENRSDVLETVGDYPAIMGFELGGIEMGDEKSLDSVPFNRIRKELIAHHERGGIVTISWHPRNPLTGGTAWDVDNDQVVKSILPDGSEHEKFELWMKRLGDFIASLKDNPNSSKIGVTSFFILSLILTVDIFISPFYLYISLYIILKMYTFVNKLYTFLKYYL